MMSRTAEREASLIDVPSLITDRLVERLTAVYARTWGTSDMAVPEIIAWAAELSLENIARSDALYHDVEHTMMVTDVGGELLRCRHLREGGVTPRDWLHVILSLLFHDIGYVRGICRRDRVGAYVIGKGEETVRLPAGATDASLRPWHVDRSIVFVRERFGGHTLIDVERLVRNIDYTRFPVPNEPAYHETSSYRGLCRAADLVGQLADPYYLRKIPALFQEFRETGVQEQLGFQNPSQMRAYFPEFYERSVRPWVGDALEHLRVTAQGRLWIASLHDHVFEVTRTDRSMEAQP